MGWMILAKSYTNILHQGYITWLQFEGRGGQDQGKMWKSLGPLISWKARSI